jgi:hypothetical protein
MRDMQRRYGIIFLDDTEIIFRIYETSDHEWNLYHYHSSLLPASETPDATAVLEIIGNFFLTEYAQHIADWHMCCRHQPKKLVREIARTLSITVEDISLHREQELLCKGMFTELW